MDEPQPGAVPATLRMEIAGVWRDALIVPEVAERLWGTRDQKACARVRDLIASGQLHALTTGRQYLIPVASYAAFLRGEQHSENTAA